MLITGATLKDWGLKPASYFAKAVARANELQDSGQSLDAIRTAILAEYAPPPPLLRRAEPLPYFSNIQAQIDGDADNIAKIDLHMRELMRVPTLVSGAIMPDACPSGKTLGTIPVGGVVAAKNAIHPGMHSADICCSMAVTIFDDDINPTDMLDAGMVLSHFGPGGRKIPIQPDIEILKLFQDNFFLKSELNSCVEHFATQGDGNHFFYVGHIASTGKIALVTHHGSRKPGAMLYEAGMRVAEKTRSAIAPDIAPHNAWIVANSSEGVKYWNALQIIRQWTKASHFAIHDLVAQHLKLKIQDRFWNEHNFVFQKSDGLFYHAKGATPAYKGFAADESGLTLIPLNMSAPILITKGLDAKNGLGFAPHGAGRNLSRTAYMNQFPDMTPEQMFREQTKGIDARAFCGIVDASELPGAYKNADQVRGQIEHYGLAKIIDTIEPVGSIMAGDWEKPLRGNWKN